MKGQECWGRPGLGAPGTRPPCGRRLGHGTTPAPPHQLPRAGLEPKEKCVLGPLEVWEDGGSGVWKPDRGEGQAAFLPLLPTPFCYPPWLKLFFLPVWLGVEEDALWASPPTWGHHLRQTDRVSVHKSTRPLATDFPLGLQPHLHRSGCPQDTMALEVS